MAFKKRYIILLVYTLAGLGTCIWSTYNLYEVLNPKREILKGFNPDGTDEESTKTHQETREISEIPKDKDSTEEDLMYQIQELGEQKKNEAKEKGDEVIKIFDGLYDIKEVTKDEASVFKPKGSIEGVYKVTKVFGDRKKNPSQETIRKKIKENFEKESKVFIHLEEIKTMALDPEMVTTKQAGLEEHEKSEEDEPSILIDSYKLDSIRDQLAKTEIEVVKESEYNIPFKPMQTILIEIEHTNIAKDPAMKTVKELNDRYDQLSGELNLILVLLEKMDKDMKLNEKEKTRGEDEQFIEENLILVGLEKVVVVNKPDPVEKPTKLPSEETIQTTVVEKTIVKKEPPHGKTPEKLPSEETIQTTVVEKTIVKKEPPHGKTPEKLDSEERAIPTVVQEHTGKIEPPEHEKTTVKHPPEEKVTLPVVKDDPLKVKDPLEVKTPKKPLEGTEELPKSIPGPPAKKDDPDRDKKFAGEDGFGGHDDLVDEFFQDE